MSREAMPDCSCPPMHSCPRHGLKTDSPKPPQRLERKRGTRRAKPLKAESENHAAKRKTWSFIKRCFILAQRRTNGYLSCMGCDLVTDQLDLDHITPAGSGGEWTPGNAQLLCRGPGTNDCHGKKHGQPQFTKGMSA